LNARRLWPWLLAALALVALWHEARQRPIARAPGVLAAAAPEQDDLPTDATHWRKGDIDLRPLARFAATARVLARADYRFDREAELAPVDLALGWGRMSDSAVLEKVDISQSARFYYWQVREFPIPEREIVESSANMHLAPADTEVARAIRRVRVGDVVHFEGYLVEARWPDGYRWTSSLTRSDSGPGACELVWVERFTIEPRP